MVHQAPMTRALLARKERCRRRCRLYPSWKSVSCPRDCIMPARYTILRSLHGLCRFVNRVLPSELFLPQPYESHVLLTPFLSPWKFASFCYGWFEIYRACYQCLLKLGGIILPPVLYVGVEDLPAADVSSCRSVLSKCDDNPLGSHCLQHFFPSLILPSMAFLALPCNVLRPRCFLFVVDLCLSSDMEFHVAGRVSCRTAHTIRLIPSSPPS